MSNSQNCFKRGMRMPNQFYLKTEFRQGPLGLTQFENGRLSTYHYPTVTPQLRRNKLCPYLYPVFSVWIEPLEIWRVRPPSGLRRRLHRRGHQRRPRRRGRVHVGRRLAPVAQPEGLQRGRARLLRVPIIN